MNALSRRLRDSSLRYAIAIFLSSSLLFLIEPIAGKRLLPLLGGSAAVWTACLVFFQCALLLGYLAAHWLVTRASPRVQALAYVGLLALALVQLTLAINPDLRASPAHPITSVLWLLTVLIGLPFVTLSATSPLLQAWFARSLQSAHYGDSPAGSVNATTSVVGEGPAPAVAHPYRLFAVSNVGSLLALLIYPWLIEPRLSLHDQTAGLAIGFTILAAVCAAIAYSMIGVPDLSIPRMASTPTAEPATGSDAEDGAARRVLWMSLAACGSLLLSAITNHLSQNVAAIPLMWIIPLVAYLLSFVVAFGSDDWHPRWLMLSVGALGLASAGYLLYQESLDMPIAGVVGTFCGALFCLCLFCHSELYRRRPAPRHLTTFYFFVAAGGAIGAILVGVVAPIVLSGNYEFAFGLWFAATLGLVVTWNTGWVARLVSFAASATMVALIVSQVRGDRANTLYRVRNFYGTLQVTQVTDRTYNATLRTLIHGIIEHGQQVFRTDLRTAPTTYYGHPSGVGLALDFCCDQRPRRIGVIGLGTGTMAAYGRPGDVFRFYDINPAVEPIARTYFTYLRDSPARIEIVTGDARVSLAAEAPQRYDVLVIDAFSGDAIPVHLITAQALALYRRHLQPKGIVAFHVSNHFLDLPPVVEQLARNAGLKTALITSVDDSTSDLSTADWVLVTADSAFLAQPSVASAREPIKIPRRLRLWTDDYNSLLPVLRMGKRDSL